MLKEWRSKLLDTLAIAVGLVVINFAWMMLASVIERLYARPGMLIFIFALMVIALFCLNRATTLHFTETWRARSGILGGMMMWAVCDLALSLGEQEINIWTDVVILTMAVLVIAILWLRSFTTGLHFFSTAFLFGWIGRIVLGIFSQIHEVWIYGSRVFDWSAIIFGIFGLGSLTWAFLYSRTRIQRLMVAIFVWLCLMIMINSLRGGTILKF